DAPEGDLDLRRESGAWVIENGYPATFEQVKKTLVAIADLEIIEEKTSNPERYARLGVQDPTGDDAGDDQPSPRVLSLFDDSGAVVASLLIGKTEPGGRAYVRVPGQATSWLVEGDLTLQATRTTWVETEVLAIGRDRIRSVVIEHPDQTIILGPNSETDTNFDILNLPPDLAPLRDGVGNNTAYALSYVALTDVAPVGDVDFTDAARGTWQLDNGVAIVVWTRMEDDHAWIRIEAVAPDDATQDALDEVESLNGRLGGWAFRIAAFKAGYLAETLERLTKAKPVEEGAVGPAAPWEDEAPPPVPTGGGG
ncbi:MAG: DUF4340 domain-containing protein, partial [Phycisphaerales bacterium]|nr:DUF4340 domain-containing protein [Phycisphaerales bacterium]